MTEKGKKIVEGKRKREIKDSKRIEPVPSGAKVINPVSRVIF